MRIRKLKSGPAKDSILPRLRTLALAMPDATETSMWGRPIFRINTRIFAGYGEQDGRPCIWLKVGKERQRRLLRDFGDLYSDYVGCFGSVSLALERRIDWNEVARLLLDSYRRVAPRKHLALMDAPPRGRRPSRRK